MARVLVPLAEGCEELEAVTIIDLLRRAKINVITAGLKPGPITASRGVVLLPDVLLEKVLEDNFDMVVLPGGLPGADYLDQDPRVHLLLKSMLANNKFIAAICAAPKVLAGAGLLANRRVTSYPGVLDKMIDHDFIYTGDAVTVDGLIITSRGPGTAMDFALQLIEILVDKTARDAVEMELVRR